MRRLFFSIAWLLALMLPAFGDELNHASTSKAGDVGIEWQKVSLITSPVGFSRLGNDIGVNYGKLRFEGGLTFAGDVPFFGGFSGLIVDADGRSGMAVSDEGYVLRFNLAGEEQQISGLASANYARLVEANNQALDTWKSNTDAEAMSMSADGRRVTIGFERSPRLLSYDLQNGLLRNPISLPLPYAVQRVPHNKGIEAIVELRKTGAMPGERLVFLEQPLERVGQPQGWLLRSSGSVAFHVPDMGSYSITDAAQDSRGRIYVLERRFTPILGAGVRIRRFQFDDLVAGFGAGEILLQAGWMQMVDNYEGLALHEAEGRIYLTLISDNNFNILQRNLLMRFSLPR